MKVNDYPMAKINLFSSEQIIQLSSKLKIGEAVLVIHEKSILNITKELKWMRTK